MALPQPTMEVKRKILFLAKINYEKSALIVQMFPSLVELDSTDVAVSIKSIKTIESK